MKNKSLIATRHAKRVPKKKKWSLSNKEILHQRLLRRVLIRTLDFGIDFAIWSNLEDNYRCDTREKIGHAGGESERKTWPRRTVNWIPILPSTYEYKGSNSLQTKKKSRIKIKAQGNKLETWPGFIIMNFIKKNLFSFMNSQLGSILLGTYNE